MGRACHFAVSIPSYVCGWIFWHMEQFGHLHIFICGAYGMQTSLMVQPCTLTLQMRMYMQQLGFNKQNLIRTDQDTLFQCCLPPHKLHAAPLTCPRLCFMSTSGCTELAAHPMMRAATSVLRGVGRQCIVQAYKHKQTSLDWHHGARRHPAVECTKQRAANYAI